MKATLTALILALLGTTALAAPGPHVDDRPDVSDPFEGANRVSYDVSHAIDQVTLRPIAHGYNALPSPIRTGVRNLLDHINTPTTVVNDLLQGDINGAAITVMRFGANTIAGFGGLYDFAAAQGLSGRKEDFGQTLGVWGVGAGPYVFIPLMGPSNARDIVGKVADTATNPLTWVGGASGRVALTTQIVAETIDTRASVEDLLTSIEANSVDPYATIRSIYTQSRQADIENGEFDAKTLPDFE
jgi:phospholipid-binding lipoprotein MlaA